MQRDQRVLEAAERLFAERGFDGVGVDEIGKAAGINGSSIYRYFSSKDEILAILFDQVIDALLLGIGQPLPDPFDELQKLVRSHADVTVRFRRLAGIWVHDERCLAAPHRRKYDRRKHRYMERWLETLDLCYPGNSPQKLTAAVRAAQLMLMSDALRPSSSPPPPEVYDYLCRATLEGLAVLGADVAAAAG